MCGSFGGAVLEEEKKREIKKHLSRLKLLRATPRSDWHREFERIFRLEAQPYGKDVRIVIQHYLGEEPPRIDYIILDDFKRLMHGKSIFRIFRKKNVIEYKNPHDSLNERTIRKICGYANFYIGTADHEGDVPSNEVSISIFRAVKNKELFDEMEKEGTLVRTEAKGIYHVKKITDLPFQIVITDELEGDEYAAYRALTDHANAKDVEILLNAGKMEQNADSKERYRNIIRFVGEKNPEIMEKVIGGEEEMSDVLMDILKPRIDKKINDAILVDRMETAKSLREMNMDIDSIAKVLRQPSATVQEWLGAASVS